MLKKKIHDEKNPTLRAELVRRKHFELLERDRDQATQVNDKFEK